MQLWRWMFLLLLITAVRAITKLAKFNNHLYVAISKIGVVMFLKHKSFNTVPLGVKFIKTPFQALFQLIAAQDIYHPDKIIHQENQSKFTIVLFQSFEQDVIITPLSFDGTKGMFT